MSSGFGKDLAERYRRDGWWDGKTLIGMFLENSRRNPERTAIVDPPNKADLVKLNPERISYSEAKRKVDSLASYFHDLGISKGDIVIIQLPNIAELLITYLAVWRAGATISPLPVQWRTHELKRVLGVTKSPLYISTEFKGFDHLAMMKSLSKENSSVKNIVSLADVREAMNNHKVWGDLDDRTGELTGDDIAVIQWTSGTEKDPKACPMSHNNWGFLRYFYRPEYKGGILKDGDVVMNPAPLVNMTGIGVGIVPWIMIAGTFVLHQPFDPTIYFRQLIGEKVNFTLAVPAVAVAMLKHPDVDKFNLSATKVFLQGSAPPPPWTFVEFKKRWGIESINVWGQNEGTGLFSTKEIIQDLAERARSFPWPGEGKLTDVPFFKPIETRIVDLNTGKDLSEPGSTGELCYRSPMTVPSYYNQPELTDNAYDDQGFFHTGDLFTIVDSNRIAFFDRAKDIIIRGGFNISSAEIEDIAKRDPRIADAAAVPLPDEKLGERVCLFVVPRNGAVVTLETVKALMKENDVAIYKWPERVETIDSIPRNPVGKALKAELKNKIR
jgi:acyl-CoA synthetase (AMP-forming)/AMP-acid ligase II